VSPNITRFLPWLWYPLLVITTILLHLTLVASGLAITYSTYIPILLAAVVITLLEVYFPYRDSWKPKSADILNDVSFMLIVQVLLPQFLVYLFAIWLIHLGNNDTSLWPSELPNGFQVILMILLADFLRYWLHRASHEFMLLWQLHAVHHSPNKLYWLNVGRFHPLEKAVQFLFDALPFIILGVDQSVLSLYFVFYAVNGYFQHSNIDLRFGWLNYLISSPELHRWHHSKKVEESNRNYGNNIIIWDVLFGTYFLPKDRMVDDLGLKNSLYPHSFLGQLKTPFIPRLEKRNLPIISYVEIMMNALLKFRFLILFLGPWTKLLKLSKSPMKAQNKLLKEILDANKDSTFGQAHGFSSINSAQEYAKACPIQNYDSLQPFITDPHGKGLTTEPAVFYQVTSGTTGSAKYLPVTKTGLSNDKKLQNMVAFTRYISNSCAYTGKIFAIVSPAIEGYNDDGIPYGSASGLTYMNMPYLARSKYVVPYAVFEIENYLIKYQLIALFALSEPSVSLVATANPSTLVRLLEIINENTELLLTSLSFGIKDFPGIEQTLLARIDKCLTPDKNRAAALRKIFTANKKLSYLDIWPNLQQLVTWTGGSCGIALSSLKKGLADSTDIVEMGYLASEVRATLTLGREIGLPTFMNTFYEFIERDDWEADKHNVLLLDQLQKGKQYYIIITTVNGLYRYFMNDIIEVNGFYKQCPTIRFLQKGKGATNITGEKLYESQVLKAIQLLEGDQNIAVRFMQWLADEESAHYRVYLECEDAHLDNIEHYTQFLEQALCDLNMEYRQKRASERLKIVEVKLLKQGSGEEFKRFNLAKGQREGQYKTLSLIYSKDARFNFESHTLSAGDD